MVLEGNTLRYFEDEKGDGAEKGSIPLTATAKVEIKEGNIIVASGEDNLVFWSDQVDLDNTKWFEAIQVKDIHTLSLSLTYLPLFPRTPYVFQTKKTVTTYNSLPPPPSPKIKYKNKKIYIYTTQYQGQDLLFT